MRSAIYYPHTTVRSNSLMRSSLLLWDKLHVIVPRHHFAKEYNGPSDLAEAWELIGAAMEPSPTQKLRAHDAIEETLLSRTFPADLYRLNQIEQIEDHSMVWMDKFMMDTWSLLRSSGFVRHALTEDRFEMKQLSSLMMMTKLADACAGTQFARVTDKLSSYTVMGNGEEVPGQDCGAVPITLKLIDASSIPLRNLLDFRKREAIERNGSDYSKLRHNYADRIQAHMKALQQTVEQSDFDELNRIFEADMEEDLRDLRTELRVNKQSLFLKPVIVASTAAMASAMAGAGSVSTLAAAAVGAVCGANWDQIGASVSDLIKNKLDFDKNQRETMRKHPMAYMYELSRHH